MAYEFDGRIRFSEVGSDRRQTLVSIVDYFQDASIFHSEDRNLGLDYSEEHHSLWLLLFWQIDIARRPVLGEHVISRTMPYEFKTFYGMRNFVLLGEGGEYLAKANSVWALMDTQSGRPIRVPQEQIDGYGIDPRLDMEYLPRKIAVPDPGEKMEPFSVGEQHLDTNFHVNNGQYVRMAENYLPEGFERARLCVEYRKQAFLHDRIVPYVYREAHAVTVSLCDEDGAPFAIVKMDSEDPGNAANR